MATGAVKKSKKPMFIIFTVAFLGVLAGSGITYAVFRADINDPSPPQSAVQNEQVKQIVSEGFDQKIPEGTLTPTQVLENAGQYTNKEVQIRGRIVETTDNKYILTSSEVSGKGAVPIEAAVPSVDLTKYLAGFSDPKKATSDLSKDPSPTTMKPVTVTGSVVIENGTAKVKVTQVEQ